MFTTVASYHDPIEAHIACGRLRAEGVDAHVADDQTAVANWEWRLAVGGIRLRVADADATRAYAVLRELESGGYALVDEAALNDAFVRVTDRESRSSRIAWIALMLFGIPLPWRRRHRDSVAREM